MQSRYMDPLKSAQKKFSRMSQVQMDGEPVTKVEIEGEESPEQEGLPEQESMSEALGDDDGPLEEGEMAVPDSVLEELKAKFQQEAADTGEEPEGWDDPYSDPVEPNEGSVEDFGFSPEEVEDYAAQLQEKGIDLTRVRPKYLQSEFGLASTEAAALVQQLQARRP